MSNTTAEIAGYRLGEPIPLADFLALVSDGVRYGRDEHGRLRLMAPDDARYHRLPLGLLDTLFKEQLPRATWTVIQEPGVALPVVWDLRGRELPESRLGPKQLEPDLAVFEGRPRVRGQPGGTSACTHEALRLVVELLSPGTGRHDLGLGQADQVDRWRTYFESGVSEYWLLNLGAEGLPLPPRSGLFLGRGQSGWQALPSVGDLPQAESPVRDQRPVLGGVVASAAVPGLRLDLDAYWAEALGHQGCGHEDC